MFGCEKEFKILQISNLNLRHRQNTTNTSRGWGPAGGLRSRARVQFHHGPSSAPVKSGYTAVCPDTTSYVFSAGTYEVTL